FAVCLEGRISERLVKVDKFRLAEIGESTPNGVKYKRCDVPGYVGMAHNHLPTDGQQSPCYFSGTDQRSFNNDDAALIDVVICGDARFVQQTKRRR
ncbi:MAG TPA: hypothetical protein VM100_05740, partial [Longimicrobiales bacterium]|nr:hypothetical protein [Longimicrobiales bacterium]